MATPSETRLASGVLGLGTTYLNLPRTICFTEPDPSRSLERGA